MRFQRTLAPVALALSCLVSTSCINAAPVPIPDMEVAGPSDAFDMGSRLMTSPSRMTVRVTIPGKGTVKLPKFNGTFFYRHDQPQATTATLLLRPDEIEDVEGSVAEQLGKALDFEHHPFFAFQSRSASVTEQGIALAGTLIVKLQQADATLILESPGEVAVNDAGERFVEIHGGMTVKAAALGLGAIGDVLDFDFDFFLMNYTAASPKAKGVDTATLDNSPPRLPTDAEGLSNAGWYLILTGRYAEAIAAFDRSIELDPRNVNTYLRRGDAYLFNGDYGKAMGTYKAMTTYIPVHPHIMELTKVLDREYLTPAMLQEGSEKWLAKQ